MGLIDFKNIKRRRINEDEDYLTDTTGLGNKKSMTKKSSLQQLIKDNNSEIVTKDIVQALFIRFSNHRFLINNAYIFNDYWESDFITVTESMYVYEIECKKSKSDYYEDFHKKEKHILLESKDSDELRPNRFYYCTPRGMLASREIPSYAGLMEVSRVSGVLKCETVVEAPFIHKLNVFDPIKDSLLQKLSWRYRDIMLSDYENQIKVSLE